MSNPSVFHTILLEIFGDPSLKHQEILLSSLEQCKSAVRTPCNRRISRTELSFECHECALDLQCHLFCADCFLSISHKNHKFRYSTDKAGLCDCGNAFAVKTHCRNHEISQISGALVKEYIPLKIAEKIRGTLLRKLVEFVSFCENCEKVKETAEESRRNAKKFAGLLRTLQWFCDKQSPATDLLVIDVFLAKARESQAELTHTCNNLILLQYESAHLCDCSLLELCFRFALVYKDEKFWRKLREIFENLLKYPHFLKELALTYAKMWNFVVYLPKYPQISALKVSVFFTLYPHFFARDISEIWLKASHFLINLIEKTADIIDSFFTSLNVHAYNAFDQIKSLFLFVLKRESLKNLLTEPRILETFVQVINRTHNPKNLIEEDNEKCRLHIECTLLLIFKNFLSILQKNLEFQKKLAFFQGILAKILRFLKEIYEKPANNLKEMQNKWPLHNTLQRALTLILISLLFHGESEEILINPSKLNENPSKFLENSSTLSENPDNSLSFAECLRRFSPIFNEKVKEIFGDSSTFYTKTIQTLLISIKFSQEKVKPVTFYELFENPFEGMKREVINGFYKKSYYLQNDYDQVLLQLLLILCVDLKEFVKTFAFSFDLDLPQIFFKANDETYQRNLKSFLLNLVALANDETSLLNTTGFLQLNSRELRDSLRFLLINTFQNPRICDIKSAKSLLYDKVLSFDVAIEQIIKEVTCQLPNSRILRLKPENQQYYDPYIFYKYPKLTNECYENIKKLTKTKGNDLIIGNYFNENPEVSFISLAKTRLFSSELPRFLAVILKIDAFTKDCNEIVKNTVKLLYLSLRICEKHALKCEEIHANYRQFYQQTEFVQRLETLKNKPQMQEIRSSFEKLLELLRKLKETLTNEPKKHELTEKLPAKAVDESFFEKKPANFSKKQEKLKQEFLLKQKVFLQKNISSTLVEEIPLKKPSKAEISCLYCYETLSESSSFGVYVYLALDNLLCKSAGPLKDFFKKIQKSKPTFSLTSCLHYVHKECNEKLLKNNLKALLQKKVLFTSILESLCGHCKSLNNLFVFFVEEKIVANNFRQLNLGFSSTEFTHNYIVDIIKSLSFTLEVKGTVKEEFRQGFIRDCTDFFDFVLKVFMNYEENEEFLKKGDASLLQLMLDILQTSARNVSLNGLGVFFKKNRQVYRNFYLMYREYFWLFQSKDKEKYVEELKKDAFALISSLFLCVERPDLEEIDQKSELLFWILAVFFKNDDSTLFLMVSHMCRQVYCIFLLYYAYFQWISLHPESNFANFSGFLDKISQEMQKNSEYKALMATNLVPITRKLIGTLTIIFRFEETELSEFFPENFLTDEEELEFYRKSFAFLSIDSDFSQLKTACFEGFYAQLLQTQGKSCVSPKDFLTYYPLSYHILPLPRTFYELQQAFGLRKCEICNEFSRKGPLYMCLICGELLCPVDCKLEKKGKVIGNLNSHAKVLHSGKGGFMNMRDSLVILLNYPRSISWGNLYKDQYGESVNERTWEWEKFELDAKMYAKIQDIIIGKRIPQEICYRLMENEELVIDVDYL